MLIKYTKLKFNKKSMIFLVSQFFHGILTSRRTAVFCRTQFGKCWCKVIGSSMEEERF